MSDIQKLQDALAETIRLVDAKDEIIRNQNNAVTESFKDGARYAIEYFKDNLYGDGVMDTDIWRDFMGCPECESMTPCEHDEVVD